MKDLGYKDNYGEAIPAQTEKNKVRYPVLSIGSEYGSGPNVELPVDPMETDKTYTATVKLRCTNAGGKTANGKKSTHYTFEVTHIDFEGDSDDPGQDETTMAGSPERKNAIKSDLMNSKKGEK